MKKRGVWNVSRSDGDGGFHAEFDPNQVQPEPSPEVVGSWGLLDTAENVWMGNNDGPRIFTDYMLARLAAQMVDVQLGQEPGRTRASEFAAANLRLRGTVPVKMSAKEALRGMESGEYL